MVHALVAALLLATAFPATAEKADREKPINIEADRVTVDDAKQISNFEGRVVLTQGTLVIRGDRMEVRQDDQGFNSGITWGNLAYFRQKREGYDEYIEGWAERIEYDGRADKLQMFNRASMKKTGGDEVHGNYISYDANTEFFQVIGGGSKTAAESPDRRVRAVLQPKPKAKPAAQPPVSLKPAATIASPRDELSSPR
ncbi:MAG: lipopolysaccharide transport periplasmic protein LptA [Burkholderiales bacterium]|nr:lipopolysaccharide transport periplasmic protein LptA [Burkholderiales bacterium]